MEKIELQKSTGRARREFPAAHLVACGLICLVSLGATRAARAQPGTFVVRESAAPCLKVRARPELIRTDGYTALPLCTAADVGASPSFISLRAAAKAGRLTAAPQRLFEAPRARIELFDLTADPWELRKVADDPAYAGEVRELAGALQEWIEQSGDFPAEYRVRDDNTDRLTGV
jgi:hypothetical protein